MYLEIDIYGLTSETVKRARDAVGVRSGFLGGLASTSKREGKELF